MILGTAPAQRRQRGTTPAAQAKARQQPRGQQPLNHSVGRAMAILSAFGPQSPHLGVSEVARQLGLSRSAASRLLASLEAGGFVVQHPRTGRFQLGLRALELGYAAFQTNELIMRAAPYLTQVARDFQLCAHLYGMVEGELFRYVTVEYPPNISMLGGFRFRGRLHTTAAGKVLLAHLPEAERAELIQRLGLPAATHNTITDPERLRSHLAQVRRQGYALDDEESSLGTRCIAVPVRDIAGTVVAAASVSGPPSRLTDQQVPLLRDRLLDAAERISAVLEHVPGAADSGVSGKAAAAQRLPLPAW